MTGVYLLDRPDLWVQVGEFGSEELSMGETFSFEITLTVGEFFTIGLYRSFEELNPMEVEVDWRFQSPSHTEWFDEFPEDAVEEELVSEAELDPLQAVLATKQLQDAMQVGNKWLEDQAAEVQLTILESPEDRSEVTDLLRKFDAKELYRLGAYLGDELA